MSTLETRMEQYGRFLGLSVSIENPSPLWLQASQIPKFQGGESTQTISNSQKAILPFLFGFRTTSPPNILKSLHSEALNLVSLLSAFNPIAHANPGHPRSDVNDLNPCASFYSLGGEASFAWACSSFSRPLQPRPQNLMNLVAYECMKTLNAEFESGETNSRCFFDLLIFFASFQFLLCLFCLLGPLTSEHPAEQRPGHGANPLELSALRVGLHEGKKTKTFGFSLSLV